MRFIGRVIQFIVGLAVLVGLVGLAGWIVYSSVTTAPAVVAAVITGFAALIGLAVQRYLEQQREDLRARRERMAPIYEDLVQLLFDGSKSGEGGRRGHGPVLREVGQAPPGVGI